MVVKNLYLAAIVLLLSACNPNSTEGTTEDTSFPEWFEGNYEYTNDYGIYREYWKKKSSEEYIGKGYFLHKGDTSFLMRMKLYKEEGSIKMDYNVKGQNEGKTVLFTLSKFKDGIYVFENPFRGFPSIMEYRILNDSIITVTEKGFEGQKEENQKFTIKKIGSN